MSTKEGKNEKKTFFVFLLDVNIHLEEEGGVKHQEKGSKLKNLPHKNKRKALVRK